MAVGGHLGSSALGLLLKEFLFANGQGLDQLAHLLFLGLNGLLGADLLGLESLGMVGLQFGLQFGEALIDLQQGLSTGGLSGRSHLLFQKGLKAG